MASLLQCEDLCVVSTVPSVATIFRSSEYSTPIQSHFYHSMLDSDLPASTATAVPSSSVYSTPYIQSSCETYTCDADYLEDEAIRDFWREFEFSELALNQRGVDVINQEVASDQMGRPALPSRKRHKGLLGGVTEFDPTVSDLCIFVGFPSVGQIRPSSDLRKVEQPTAVRRLQSKQPVGFFK